jgi:hypothetical protein
VDKDLPSILQRIAGAVNLDDIDSKSELQLRLDDFSRSPKNAFHSEHEARDDRVKGRNYVVLTHKDSFIARTTGDLKARLLGENKRAGELQERYFKSREEMGAHKAKTKAYERVKKRAQRARYALVKANLLALTSVPLPARKRKTIEGRKFAYQKGYSLQGGKWRKTR